MRILRAILVALAAAACQTGTHASPLRALQLESSGSSVVQAGDEPIRLASPLQKSSSSAAPSSSSSSSVSSASLTKSDAAPHQTSSISTHPRPKSFSSLSAVNSTNSTLPATDADTTANPLLSYNYDLLAAQLGGVDYRVSTDYRAGRSPVHAIKAAPPFVLNRFNVQFQRVSIVKPLTLPPTPQRQYVSFSCIPMTHTYQPLRSHHNVFFLRHHRHRVFCDQFRNVQAEDFTFEVQPALLGSATLFVSYSGIKDEDDNRYDASNLLLSIQAKTLHLRMQTIDTLKKTWDSETNAKAAASWKVERVRVNALAVPQYAMIQQPTQRYSAPPDALVPTNPPHHHRAAGGSAGTRTGPGMQRGTFHIITPPPPRNPINTGGNSASAAAGVTAVPPTYAPLLQDPTAGVPSSVPSEVKSVQLQYALKTTLSTSPQVVTTQYLPLNSPTVNYRWCTRVGNEYISVAYVDKPKLISLAVYRDAVCTNQAFQASLANGGTATYQVTIFTATLSPNAPITNGPKSVPLLPGFAYVKTDEAESTFRATNSIDIVLCVSRDCVTNQAMGRYAVAKLDVSVEKSGKTSMTQLTPPVCSLLMATDAHHKYPLYVKLRSYFRRNADDTTLFENNAELYTNDKCTGNEAYLSGGVDAGQWQVAVQLPEQDVQRLRFTLSTELSTKQGTVIVVPTPAQPE